MFVREGDKGASFSVKSRGDVHCKSDNVKWFGKGDNVKTFSNRQIFLHKGDGTVFDVKASRVILKKCCGNDEQCCEGHEKSEAECPHPIEVHQRVRHSNKNVIHI